MDFGFERKIFEGPVLGDRPVTTLEKSAGNQKVARILTSSAADARYTPWRRVIAPESCTGRRVMPGWVFEIFNVLFGLVEWVLLAAEG